MNVMYINRVHNNLSEPPNYRLIRSDNYLGIEKIDCIRDNQRKRLILIMESNQMVGDTADAILTGNNLVLEASVAPNLNYKPIRTHLVNNGILDEYNDGDLDIGFSKIKLNPGFRYIIYSCQVIHPGLVKIVLGYKPSGIGKNKNVKSNN